MLGGWKERANKAERALKQVHTTHRERQRSPEARQRWLDAVAAFNAAIEDVYPPGFWEHFSRLKDGDADAVESAVHFLEADPWFFRSGYLKAELIKRLNRNPFAPHIEARLTAVCLRAAKERDRREFRSYCHLARQLGNELLRKALAELAVADGAAIRRRARWMLDAMKQERRRPVSPRRLKE